MLRLAVTAALLYASSVAMPIDDVVKGALKNNPNIQSLQEAINASNINIKLSQKWANPVMSLGINDVQEDISKRDLEPMQSVYIGLSQQIPINDRLTHQKNISINDVNMAKYQLQDAKLMLQANIYKIGYLIRINQERLKLFKTYLNNLEKLLLLNQSLYESGKVMQNEILKTQIAYNKTQINVENIQNGIQNLFYKLEELSSESIDKIDISLGFIDNQSATHLSNHPKLQLAKEWSKKLNNTSKYELSKKYSDVKLSMAYFQREGNFNDYMNFALSIPLSVYESENLKASQAKIKAKQMQRQEANIFNQLTSQMKSEQNNLRSAHKKYELLKKAILPKKELMQQNIEQYNSLQKIRPQMLLQNLNETIALELESLNELEKYFNAWSQLLYLKGKIQ